MCFSKRYGLSEELEITFDDFIELMEKWEGCTSAK